MGLQATAQRYAVLYRSRGNLNTTSPNTLSFIPAQLTVGYHVSDRLSLQTGLAFRHYAPNYVINFDNATTGQPWEQRDLGTNSWAIPLQARWRLAALPRRALRAELLLGVMYLGASGSLYYGPVVNWVEPSSLSVQTVQGTAGLGLVRAFGPRLTGNFDLMLNRSFNQRENAAHSQVQSSAISFYTVSLGVRYNFK